MLTILTWLWKQPGLRAGYSAHHVNIWAAMVRRHLVAPHRLACVTSDPEGIDPSIEIITPPGELEDVRIPTWGEDRPQCLRRLSMFRRDAADIFGERFVCMDLDCVVARPLDPLFETDADFKICTGTAPGRPYNGSMMLIRAGSRPQVYERFTAEAAAGRRFVGSDQAWISHVLPRERTWDANDGVFWWSGHANSHLPGARVMFFPGATKPWDLIGQDADPWVSSRYRGDRPGRCMILGYAPSVWSEAERALDSGPFDCVIASPEAAAHWPAEHLVARTDAQAERLAAMLGFKDVVFCGRSERVSA
jgi:hypothetical protein